MIINKRAFISLYIIVVNWFQIVSLSYWLSTNKNSRNGTTTLWIGFKLYLCLIDYQLYNVLPSKIAGCELVSNCIFVLLIINFAPNFCTNCKLWIGFKLYLCLIDYQQQLMEFIIPQCCELVSNCIFVLLIINLQMRLFWTFQVVNWFQIVSLSYWLSTLYCCWLPNSLLWIGFKLYLCLIDYQLEVNDGWTLWGCELVSNCIFVLLIINTVRGKEIFGRVVNWFQIVSLSYWLSTE